MRPLVFGFLAAYLLILPGTSNAAPQPSSLDRLEASVNSALILSSDVRRFRETLKLRAQLDPLFTGTSIAAKGASSPDSEIVDFLINEKLISSQFPASDTDVETEINSIQANNHIERTQLKSALTDQGFSFDDYFEMIRASISKRNLIERDIRTKVTISDDDIKNHYYNNYSRAKATGPKSYQIKIIAVRVKNYKSQAAAKTVAEDAAKSLKKGEVFDEVAKRVSDDPSAKSGGDLGTLTEDQISPVMREQLKKLKIGETSPVFGGGKSSAFFILKLMDIQAGEGDQYEKAKDEIRNHLYAAEYQHQIQLWLERQRQTAFIHRSGELSTAGLPSSK